MILLSQILNQFINFLPSLKHEERIFKIKCFASRTIKNDQSKSIITSKRISKLSINSQIQNEKLFNSIDKTPFLTN
jgi:hypothetical protein